MNILPAIDLFSGKVVRLLKGDYNNMTVYSDNPCEIAADFERNGAKFIHIVDLEGAKSGQTKNLPSIEKILGSTSLFAEVGGGIRNMETVEKYISAGVRRVILGTAALKDEAFLRKALQTYGNRIAVGVDIKDSFVAVNGWTEVSDFLCFDFCEWLASLGVSTVICTDISKDGAMRGTNHNLYKELTERFDMDFIASGGICSIEDIYELKNNGLAGAIIGKAYYTGQIDLREAVRAAE